MVAPLLIGAKILPAILAFTARNKFLVGTGVVAGLWNQIGAQDSFLTQSQEEAWDEFGDSLQKSIKSEDIWWKLDKNGNPPKFFICMVEGPNKGRMWYTHYHYSKKTVDGIVKKIIQKGKDINQQKLVNKAIYKG